MSNKVIATVPVGVAPGPLAVSLPLGRVFVTNSGSNTVSVINPISNKVVATVTVGNAPSAIAVQPE
jgi:YVTN family beta-propeller protein